MMRKILIVDDEPNIVMTLEYAFKKRSYEVFIARDGEEAVKIAKETIPEVIILDVMMPNLDGYETLKILKKEPKLENTKIVFLSAKNKSVDIEKGINLGADKYLMKPFSIKKIINEINELIG